MIFYLSNVRHRNSTSRSKFIKNFSSENINSTTKKTWKLYLLNFSAQTHTHTLRAGSENDWKHASLSFSFSALRWDACFAHTWKTNEFPFTYPPAMEMCVAIFIICHYFTFHSHSLSACVCVEREVNGEIIKISTSGLDKSTLF